MLRKLYARQVNAMTDATTSTLADMPERQANAARSGREGRLVGMLVVAERPALK
jgi:hypothetical protein